jgi:hypothetical protein
MATRYVNKSFKAAIALCIIAATLAIVGFTLVYTLDHPSRLHWCKDPIVLNCTSANTTSIYRPYHSIYQVNYDYIGCSIYAVIELDSDIPCEFTANGYVLYNGWVCYINPNCTFDDTRMVSVLTVVIIAAFCVLVAMLSLVATLLFRYLPSLGRYTPNP